MDPERAIPAPPGAPLGIMGSLKTAFSVYFKNANTLFVIAAIGMVPVTILSAVLIRATIPGELMDFDPASGSNPFSGLTFEEIRSLIAAVIFSGVLMFVVTMVTIGACYRAVDASLAGQQPDWRSSVSAAISKLRSLLWLPTLMGVLLLGVGVVGVAAVGLLEMAVDGLGALGVVALFAGLAYVFVLWSLAVPALMSDDARGTRALARSRELIRGHWWQTFAVYMLAFLVMAVVSAVLEAIFNTRGRVGDEGLVLSTIASIVNNILFTPLQAALLGVVYLDLKAQEARSTQEAQRGPATPGTQPPALP